MSDIAKHAEKLKTLFYFAMTVVVIVIRTDGIDHLRIEINGYDEQGIRAFKGNIKELATHIGIAIEEFFEVLDRKVKAADYEYWALQMAHLVNLIEIFGDACYEYIDIKDIVFECQNPITGDSLFQGSFHELVFQMKTLAGELFNDPKHQSTSRESVVPSTTLQ